MLGGDFAPSFGLDGGRKDLGLIADAAAAAAMPTALLDGVRGLFDAAAQSGHGHDDIAAVYSAVSG